MLGRHTSTLDYCDQVPTGAYALNESHSVMAAPGFQGLTWKEATDESCKSRRAAGRPSGAASKKRVYWPNADSGGTGTNSGCVPDTSGYFRMRPGCDRDALGF